MCITRGSSPVVSQLGRQHSCNLLLARFRRIGHLTVGAATTRKRGDLRKVCGEFGHPLFSSRILPQLSIVLQVQPHRSMVVIGTSLILAVKDAVKDFFVGAPFLVVCDPLQPCVQFSYCGGRESAKLCRYTSDYGFISIQLRVSLQG